jgi:hypothetical protein
MGGEEHEKRKAPFGALHDTLCLWKLEIFDHVDEFRMIHEWVS